MSYNNSTILNLTLDQNIMKDKNLKKKPFFASFLEKQVKDPKKVKGNGIPHHTMKYPSDNDELANL